MTTWHIIYPGGDRKQIAVISLSDSLYYELGDYALASRHEFESYELADAYATELSNKHSVSYAKDEHDYLD